MRMTLKIFVLALVYMVSLDIFAGNPAVIWQSVPVNPGEAVMVYGGPWSSNAVVELSGTKKEIVHPISVTDNCLTFVYPDGWKLSELTAKIVDNGGSVSTTINSADVWWMQGDAGETASPAGWLRIFGRCIGYNDKVYVEFKRGDQTVKVFAVDFDLYSMKLNVPASLQEGIYQIFINNGFGKKAIFAGDLSVVDYKAPWFGKKLYNVVDYGAIANDRIDDSRAIFAALADLKAAGGGVLYFPRGRFGINGSIELPPNALIKGAGMELSQIYWPDEDNPVGALISGKYNFGVEDVFIASGNFNLGIAVVEPIEDDDWKNEDIIIRNVRMRLLHTDTISKEEVMRRNIQPSIAVCIVGDFIRMINCDIYSTLGGVSFGGKYLEYKGNIIGTRKCNHLGGRYAIVENNNTEGGGISFGPDSKCFYFKGNDVGYVYADGDRETFTFDGGRTTYNGTVSKVTQNGMELKSGAWRDGTDAWIDESVIIMGGKGAGQHRYISKIDGRKVEFEEPWDILPDTNSFFVIGKERHKLLFLDNHCGDGNPFQLYGSSTDVVISGNKVERNSGLHAYGMTKGGSPEPSWFVQFMDNEILEGNSVRGPWSYMVPAADGYIGFFDRGIKRPLPQNIPESRVGIMRRNILHNNSFLYAGRRVDNMLIENNVVKNADRGVVAQSKGLIVRGNRFEEVLNPYDVVQRAIFSPAEEFAGNLQAIKVVMKSDVPKVWDELVNKAESLCKEKLSDVEMNEAIASVREQATVALSKHIGDKVIDASVAKMLLGLDVSQTSIWQFNRLTPEKDTIVRVGGKKYPASGLEAVVSGETAGFKNWTISTQKNLKLVPGSTASYQLNIKRPVGALPAFKLPIEFKVSGDNWSFKFEEEYGNDQLRVTDFLVVGPFQNVSGKSIDEGVHPPEIKLDVRESYDTVDGLQPWVALKADAKGRIGLEKQFKSSEIATAHAVAVVRVSKPTLVTVRYGSNSSTLCFVNGQKIGSSSRRPGPATVELKEGDNLFQIISSHGSGRWPLELLLTVIDSVEPEDLQIVSSEQLKDEPLLTIKDITGADGKELPNSLGEDWELIYSDDFDRTRLGDMWLCKAISYKSQAIAMVDGTIASAAGWGFLTYDRDINTPVRIECDMVYEKHMAGVILCPEGLSMRSFWGGRMPDARGYCISVGWHDAVNNRIMRDGETVLLDEKTAQLEERKKYHMTAQFVPPMCQVYIDGKLYMEYKDPDFLKGLNRIGLFQISGSTFDNVRIYEAK